MMLEYEEDIATIINDLKRHENKEAREFRKNNPELAMFVSAKSRAKRLGLQFDIELSDVVMPERCPVFGIPLYYSKDHQTNNSPSIDRLDTTKGYVKGNIAVISMRANRIKSDMNPKDLLKFAFWIYKNFSKKEII